METREETNYNDCKPGCARLGQAGEINPINSLGITDITDTTDWNRNI